MSVAQGTADAVRRVRLLLATEREALASVVLKKLTPAFEVAYERVGDPESLLGALGRQPWDLIVCDPPTGDGVQHCVGAVQAAARLGIPVVAVWLEADDSRAAPLLRAGANGVLDGNRLHLLVPVVERELAAAQERRDRVLDSLVRWAPDPLLIVDADGRIQRVSAAAQELLGYAEAELAGSPVEQLLPESRRLRHAAHRASYMDAPRFRPMGKGMEFPLLAKGGIEIPVEISLAPLEVGGRALVVCGIRDLRERLSRLAPLLAFSPDPMVVLGANGRIVRANRMLLELLGYAESELIGEPIERLVPEHLRARHSAHRALYMAAPHPRPMGQGMEFFALAKDGNEIPVEISLAPVQTDGERMIACALRDLRERRRMERLIHAVFEGTATETGEGFMRSLVQNVAEALQVRYAAVVEFVGQPPDRARVLALWDGREIADPLEYPLAGTPSGKVRESGEFLALERVREAFPEARELAGLQAESYLGILLSSATGEPLGSIAILDTKPLKDPEIAKQVLRVFGVRAAAELQRQQTDAALRASEARFRALTQLSSDYYWEQDEQLRFVGRVGTPWEKRVSPEDSVLGKRRWELPALNLTEADWAKHRADLEARRPFRDLEIERPLPSGGSRWVSASGEPIFDAEGRFRGYRGIGRDITAQKLAERSLRESEERLKVLLAEQRTIFQSALTGIVYARNRRIVRCNRAFAEMLGYAPEDLIDKSTRIVYPSDEAYERFAKDAAQDFARNGRHEGEKQLVRADGGLVWVSYRVTLLDHADLSKGTVLVAVDVTERRRAEAALRESEARFRSLTQLSSDWFWQLDEHYRFMPIGPEADKSGIRPKDFVGKTPWECPGTSLTGAEWANYRAMLDARKVFRDFEYSRPSADGVVRWVSVSGEPVFDEHGRFKGYRGTGKDITQRKRSEDESRRFRLAMDSSPDMIVIVDRETMRYVDANPAVSHLLGYSREEFLSMGPQDVMPNDRQELERAYDALIADPAAVGTVNSRYRCKDGSQLPFESTRRALRSGNRWLIVAISRDIRRRLAAEETLRRSRDELRLITDSVPAMIAYFDSDYRYGYANLGYREFHTGSADAITGKTMEEVLGPEIAPLARKEISLALAGEPRNSIRRIRRHSDGSLRELEVSLVPHKDDAGQAHGVYALLLDVTRRRRAERAFEEREAQLSLLVDNVPAMICYFDAQYRYRYANRRYRDAYTHGEPVEGKTLQEMLKGEAWTAAQPHIDRALAGELTHYSRTRELPDGTRKEIEVSLIPDKNPGGRVIGVHTMILDVTERRRAEEALRLRTRAVESSVNSIMITEPTAEGQKVVYVNPAFERITGYTAAEVIGRSPRFMHGDDLDQPGVEALRAASHEQREATALVRNYRKDGSLFWNELRVAPIVDDSGRVTHMVGVGNDVTDRVRYQQEIERSANFDSLTGLPNRNLMSDRLAQAITQAGRAGRRVAVQFVDLDNLKRINDSLGHEMGDKVILAAGKRIAEAVRSGDTVARLGGDEFVIILSDLRHDEDAGAVAAKVLNFIRTPLKVNGHEFVLTASMGVALFPKDGADAPALVRHADTALYRAKEEGRNRFRFFAPEMNERVVQFLALEQDLHRALGTFEFELHYQPIVPIIGGAPLGVEALLRWRRADGRVISPAQFIPIAEESGLIVPIGRWVMERAMQQTAEWNRGRRKPLYVSINLSVRQFRDPGLVESVKEALAKTGIRPDLVTFEITESAVMQNVEEAVRLLRALKGLGVKLSVDDFGTGYSSLAYLKRFPIDVLKIDRAFIKDIVTDRGDQALCRAIIELGRAFSIDVVAEGVETRAQARVLKEHGCRLAQGYLFGRPVEAGGLRLA